MGRKYPFIQNAQAVGGSGKLHVLIASDCPIFTAPVSGNPPNLLGKARSSGLFAVTLNTHEN